MKSKLVILSLFMTGAVLTATAQTKEKFFSEKAGDNIFISIGAGAQVNTNPDNFDNSWGKAITPKLNLSVGKWFTPVWGIRGQVAGWKTTLRTDYNNFTVDNAGKITYGNVQKYNKNYVSTHLDGLMNLSHLIGGYNPDRVFNLSVFAGPGFTFAKGYGSEKLIDKGNNAWVRQVDPGKVKALINGSLGLLGQFNVNKFWDINIEARGEVSPTPYGKITHTHTDGAISLTAGATYTFGGKKFVNCNSSIDKDAINEEINKYRQALAEAEAELAACKNALENAKGDTIEIVKEIEVPGARAIFFQIGKSIIDDYGKVNIHLAAKSIKANPDKKYKIAGYCDVATGSASFNQKLSERRAQAVYDALIKEGVNASQLELIGYGGTSNMFGQDKLNRVVILE